MRGVGRLLRVLLIASLISSGSRKYSSPFSPGSRKSGAGSGLAVLKSPVGPSCDAWNTTELVSYI